MRLFYFIVLWIYSLAVVANPQFLIMTDIHYGADNALQEGEDTGPEFLNIVLKKMEQLETQVDFIINLGDLPTHMYFFTSKKGGYERTLFHRLYLADSAAKPMFYIPGNNDSLGGNYQPFVADGVSPLTYAKDWDGACLYCKDLIIDKSQMSRGGYYSSYVIPKNKELLLIALNSAPFVNVPVLASKYPHQERDAEAELAWLNHQLHTHSARQVLIAMHVPPGVSHKGQMLWLPKYQQRFITILTRHAAAYGEITLLSGHTHMDELRTLSLGQGKTVYDYSTPGISRNHHNNPGMKIVSLNDQMAVQNYTTYYTSKLNVWGNEHYQAMGSTDAIFQQCHTDTLAACLNSLSDAEVCKDLERGLFYGARSGLVPKGVCQKTYRVNVNPE